MGKSSGGDNSNFEAFDIHSVVFSRVAPTMHEVAGTCYFRQAAVAVGWQCVWPLAVSTEH